MTYENNKQLLPIISEIATNLGLEESEVRATVDEFMLQLHKRFVEYIGVNGDYLGEELNREIGNQAFFHFLGFLERFSIRYEWEQGTANEYLMRLGSRADWAPYSHQLKGWEKSKHWAD